MDSLQFSYGDPGTAMLGNFINYYDFHPPEERLKLLPENFWLDAGKGPYTCLDIGCNTGALTTKIYEEISRTFQNEGDHLELSKDCCVMLGIDVDPVLIERAREMNKYQRQVIFECVDFMSERENQSFQKYLTKCEGKFDIIFCFSITMWIHLNHGDEGLRKFLTDISSMSRLLVIEPQPWKCYKSAVKRLKRCQKAFPYFQQITIRENIEQYIEEFLLNTCNFMKVQETPETKWGRKLMFFKLK